MTETLEESIPYYAQNKTFLRGRIHLISCYISIVWLTVYLVNVLVKYIKHRNNSKKSSDLDEYSKISRQNYIYTTLSKILILSTQIILYGCSSLYHMNHYNYILQRLDHFCIFLFISSVHTSVLIMMKKMASNNMFTLESDKKKPSLQKKNSHFNLPSAQDLSFHLHPNPFSINSPIRNGKDRKQGIDLSESGQYTEKSSSGIFDTKSVQTQSEIGGSFSVDNSLFDEISQNKNEITEKEEITEQIGDSTTFIDKSVEDPSTDLSANLTSLSENTTTDSMGSMSEKSKEIDDNQENKIQDSIENQIMDWTYTDLPESQDNSYDPSLDTTPFENTTVVDNNKTAVNDNTSVIEEISLSKSKKRISFYNEATSASVNEISFQKKYDRNIEIAVPLMITWIFCLFGLIKIMLQSDINVVVDVPLYIIHGVHIVFTCHIKKVPRIILTSFISGGAFYSIGAILFGLEVPNLTNSVFGYHELFHVMTVFGNTCFLVPIICNCQLIE